MSRVKGLVYIFTGDGKGKTSAALGVAVRAVLSGMKVAWVAWYKEATWDIAEKCLPELMPIDFFLLGKGFYIKNSNLKTQISKPQLKMQKLIRLRSGGVAVDKYSILQHQKAAVAALEKAKELLKSQKYDLVVCDEINNAMADRLIPITQVRKLLESRGKTHIVLTGRNVPKEIVTLADLVTEMKKVKHPFNKGTKAIRGLDY